MTRRITPPRAELGDAADIVIATYRRFISAPPDGVDFADPKVFAAWHAAARSALAHLDHLIGLAGSDADAVQRQALDRMQAELRRQIPPATAAEEMEARDGDRTDT